VRETIHAGSGFAGWGRGSRRSLRVLPISFNLCFCCHMRVVLLWRVRWQLTGGFAILIPRMCRGRERVGGRANHVLIQSYHRRPRKRSVGIWRLLIRREI
jgi:hypothetical protein